MSIYKQKTVSKTISIRVGLILENSSLNIKPAEQKKTMKFFLTYTMLQCSACTTISNEHGIKVSTIEHLMGTCLACIDNALIEIDNEEVPILDGSGRILLKKKRRS